MVFYFKIVADLIFFFLFRQFIFVQKMNKSQLINFFLVILHLLHSTVMDCYSNCEDQTNDLFVTTSNYPNRKTFKVDEDDDE